MIQLLLFIFIAAHSIAQENLIDPFNTYLWNKENIIAKNNKIDSQDWFEWWYYKVIDPQSGEAFFFTYGIVNPWDSKKTLEGSRATLMVGDFKNKILTKKDFPLTSFNARYDSTNIKIEDNIATDKLLQGSITDTDGQNISWNLNIVHKWSFNAMGWAMPIKELSGIYWYPAQASAEISGWINFKGRIVKFENAPAYQDRNWGRSFPTWWTWIVSNHFNNSSNTVLVAGGGVPKVFNAIYTIAGLCVGLKHNGQEYAFRTSDGHNLKFDIHWGRWEIKAENRLGQRIEISAQAPKNKFMLLPFQTPQGPIFYDYETLHGHLNVKLFKKLNLKWIKVAELESDNAGIEWGSPTPVEFNKLFSSEFILQ